MRDEEKSNTYQYINSSESNLLALYWIFQLGSDCKSAVTENVRSMSKKLEQVSHSNSNNNQK